MGSHARFAFLALIGAIFAIWVPAAQAATEFGPEILVAGNCTEAFKTCGSNLLTGPYAFPKEPSVTEARVEGYTQAAGHPAWGVTSFKVKTEGTLPNEVPAGLLTAGPVKHVRTDVGPGVSTNPEAVPLCTKEQFGEKEVVPGTGFYPVPACKPETEIGVNQVTVYAGSKPFPEGGDLPIEGKAYNLEQPQGVASVFGVALELPKALTEKILGGIFKGSQPTIEEGQYYAHTLINGNVEWAGNYHDYYEIEVSTALPLISSRLILKGEIGSTGNGGYITLPSNCAGVGPATTNTVTIESEKGQVAKKEYTTPIGTEGCKGESGLTIPPFAPVFSPLGAETTQQDQPDGITTELTMPHDPSPKGIDSSQLRTAVVTLPEGLTLNPSAANGLKACTPAQIGIGTRNAVSCPAESKVGKVMLTVPDLPPGEPLTGSLYLGGPESGPISGPPYTMYVDAESARYGVSVRLKGSVVPNETTGRLTATFAENPEQPFSKLVMNFTGGPKAVLANPLACGTGTTETSFSPYTGQPAVPGSSPFTTTGCPSPLPFSLSQSTANLAPGNAGANTSFAFNLERADGQQYLEKVKTVLAPGLVGKIAGVPLCGEAQAATGECPVASQIGVATVKAGAGSAPFEFPGFVYLTGPYNGAPYGLSIVVPAVAGPFSLGNVVTRATINVEPNYPNRVTVASVLPTIFKGIPLRVKNINLNINRQGYLINPTNCSMFATETALTSTLGATQSLSSPFQVGNCSALALKPSFKAATSAKTSKALGASVETTLNQGAGQTNIRSVLVQLPKQLPSRLTTLQKACPAAVFEANPYNCPSGAFVGGVRANTPVLPDKMKGPAVLVSHANAAFPDLDLVLEADGVKVILVGNTNIKNSITSTNFATLPDVPVSSITVNLPIGAHSAVTANGNVCANQLLMPTEITGQNGFKVKQNTKMRVTGCGVRIVGEKTVGNTAYITVQTFEAGRISGSGPNLRTTYRYLGRAEKTATLKVPLSNRGRSRGRPLSVKLRVGFVPKKHGAAKSAATRTVTFR
ncbi:MAG TPA: hypothetical protein VGX26_08375 [Solirubrobacteraceae bacterium]|jgi:hypothetical protein|nr:hypothetical protein [Solirubrobacteraceae bacterium]